MQDPRYIQLAKILTEHSTRLVKGERVLLEMHDVPEEMGIALIRAIRAAGAEPHVQLHNGRISRELIIGTTERYYKVLEKIELSRMRHMNAYIAIRGSMNISETSDIPVEQLKMAAQKMRSVINYRVNNTRWVVLRWPTPAMAQQAGMSTAAFEDFYFKVCTLDYSRMEVGMKALAALMNRTDVVQIKGPGTDLRFSIKDIPCVACNATHNVPDGEIFTSPVLTSIQGCVTFNAPTIYQGTCFDRIRLEFKDGKITAATSSNTARLNQILDSDEGARYIGEFALGFNPYILHPMRDILFDEKIAGSFHITPGQAYETADNGNRSQIHWDMVAIQRTDYGGGEIWFDGELIRKDGQFVPAELRTLNEDYLLQEN